jgi:hypothetical protein
MDTLRRVRAVALAALLTVALATPAAASVTRRPPRGEPIAADPDARALSVSQDPNEPNVSDLVDLQGAAFEHSADSFQVRTTSYGTATRGNWQIVFSLTFAGSNRHVTVTGRMLDTPRGPVWAGYVARDQDGTERPIPSFDYFDNLNLPSLSGRSSFGYANWADVVGPGVAIPLNIGWSVQTRLLDGEPRDRLPDGAIFTVEVRHNAAATTTQVTKVGYRRVDRAFGEHADLGRLLRGGQGLANRFVELQFARGGVFRARQTLGVDDVGGGTDVTEFASDAQGTWLTAYRPARNLTLRGYFPGDGFSASSVSAPYRVLVPAWVTLDLPASSTADIGHPVRFHGVVRPRQPGTQVTIEIRRGGPGAPWSTFRRLLLVNGAADTYYDTTWRPTVRGTFTFRTVWTHGTTADGGNTNGVSGYAVVTVR